MYKSQFIIPLESLSLSPSVQSVICLQTARLSWHHNEELHTRGGRPVTTRIIILLPHQNNPQTPLNSQHSRTVCCTSKNVHSNYKICQDSSSCKLHKDEGFAKRFLLYFHYKCSLFTPQSNIKALPWRRYCTDDVAILYIVTYCTFTDTDIMSC